ncbi:MAG: hypothetical protein WBG30_10075 [Psychrilyobacter sp.]|uniref:hypothetical protein n=1 Tax=Psychrilyobacter sp. TaxID=2586924 RepID=UPI003C753C43
MKKETIKFYSIEPFFSKEKSGIKNNTVRFTDHGERFKALKKFDLKKEIFVEIINPNTFECFTRQIKDVSIYENIFIITWRQ